MQGKIYFHRWFPYVSRQPHHDQLLVSGARRRWKSKLGLNIAGLYCKRVHLSSATLGETIYQKQQGWRRELASVYEVMNLITANEDTQLSLHWCSAEGSHFIATKCGSQAWAACRRQGMHESYDVDTHMADDHVESTRSSFLSFAGSRSRMPHSIKAVQRIIKSNVRKRITLPLCRSSC